MYTNLLLPALSGLVLVVVAQTPTEPAIPTSTVGIPTIEGALVYDGPPVVGFTGPGGNATVQSNLPAATYEAILPSTNFDNATGTLITGSIIGSSVAGGAGVAFTVNFAGFPSEAQYGPFVYHVHALPVPSDGNCTGTMGHLDPTDRGELHACETQAPQTCQAGDLAGKHGNITASTWNVSYSDLYLSTDPSSPYYFGDKSVVIHTSNTTRLTCANFTMVSTNSTSNGTSPTTGSPSATITPFQGAASTNLANAGMLAGVAAIFAAFLW